MSKYRITMDGKTYEMEVELVKDDEQTASASKGVYKLFKNAGKDSTVRLIDPSAEKKTTNKTGVVKSPMPGTVIEVNKAVGDAVAAGEVILILEAMKMENEITAPIGGTLISLNCEAGQTVAGNDILFEIQ